MIRQTLCFEKLNLILFEYGHSYPTLFIVVFLLFKILIEMCQFFLGLLAIAPNLFLAVCRSTLFEIFISKTQKRGSRKYTIAGFPLFLYNDFLGLSDT